MYACSLAQIACSPEYHVVQLLMPDMVVPASQKWLPSWVFSTLVSRYCREWCYKKHPVGSSSVGENNLLMREVMRMGGETH
uniref:Uncharacterized protein n=1 Tax=Anguilla anguilla TaxID=7936 RepID=A0A0E9PMG4_ANGAN